MMPCPDCRGSGRTIASHVRYASGGGACNVPMKCSQCGGTGQIPDAMLDWIARGKAMRDRRVEVERRSLREEAKRRGMSPSELSAMEQGRCEPVEG